MYDWWLLFEKNKLYTYVDLVMWIFKFWSCICALCLKKVILDQYNRVQSNQIYISISCLGIRNFNVWISYRSFPIGWLLCYNISLKCIIPIPLGDSNYSSVLKPAIVMTQCIPIELCNRAKFQCTRLDARNTDFLLLQYFESLFTYMYDYHVLCLGSIYTGLLLSRKYEIFCQKFVIGIHVPYSHSSLSTQMYAKNNTKHPCKSFLMEKDNLILCPFSLHRIPLRGKIVTMMSPPGRSFRRRMHSGRYGIDSDLRSHPGPLLKRSRILWPNICLTLTLFLYQALVFLLRVCKLWNYSALFRSYLEANS